jgi:hypothetical protein
LRASPDADEKGEALDIGKIAKGPPKKSAEVNGVNEAIE